MKSTGNHSKTRRIASIVLVVSVCVGLAGCTRSEADVAIPRPDLITLGDIPALGKLERPAVVFQHDLHTAALTPRGKDCHTCHPDMDNGRRSLKFFRLVDSDRETLMHIYHDNCVACHEETAAAGLKAGPTICGDCHRRFVPFVSSRQPIGFDRSLHERHVEGLREECSRCHHEYNEKTHELFYAKGKEVTCRYCHLSGPHDNVPSLSVAAHWACVGCHSITPDAGPVDCAGCHDAARQKQIKRIAHPKRLYRGQPDFVLLRVDDKDLASSELDTVPFPHLVHETGNPTCRGCHHESMTPCIDCHTLAGSDKSKGVTLQRAMHAMDSNHSCAGCHNLHKKDTPCAGCHSLMEQGRLSEHACTVCHAGPSPATVKHVEDRYTSLAPFEPKPQEFRLSFAEDDIPETVTIGVLSKKYEPVTFPHRLMVNKLRENIRQSPLATYFHGRDDVVCQGCHHQSPVGVKPPVCRSCHGRPFNEAELSKPGLFGAYHRQCIECHQAMQRENPSDCQGCHKLKVTAAGN